MKPRFNQPLDQAWGVYFLSDTGSEMIPVGGEGPRPSDVAGFIDEDPPSSREDQ